MKFGEVSTMANAFITASHGLYCRLWPVMAVADQDLFEPDPLPAVCKDTSRASTIAG